MNLASVAELQSRPISAVWYRAIAPQHLTTALKYKHGRLSASRFYQGPASTTPFDIVYLAEN